MHLTEKISEGRFSAVQEVLESILSHSDKNEAQMVVVREMVRSTRLLSNASLTHSNYAQLCNQTLNIGFSVIELKRDECSIERQTDKKFRSCWLEIHRYQ